MQHVKPVLIIGAGPVGLTTAAMLAHYGVPVRIIDKKPLPCQTSNAVAIHARSLELFNLLGLAEKFLKAGRLAKSMEMYANRLHLASVNFDLIESQYNYVCCVPQSITEQILIEYLQSLGVLVERSHELINLCVGMDHLVMVATNKETIEANWVVACDGYHSKVREVMNIPFEGDDLKLDFMMIDAPVSWDLSLDSLYAFFSEDVSLALFPMQDSVRMIAEVSHAPQFQNVEPDENVFMDIAEQCVPGDFIISKLLWRSKFSIHERLARQYIDGHVILAGDAAHAHSPAGGQGMNTGLQDAINLAWKLALVVRGEAHENLLSSYEEERRPVAQQVLSISGYMTDVALSKNIVLSKLRNILMPLLTKLSTVQKKIIGFIGETAINYEKSSIVSGQCYHHLHPGGRSAWINPTFGLKYILIDFKGDAQEAFTDNEWVQVIAASTLDLPDDLRRLDNVYCILRPDFYIGYLGDNLHDAQQYFQKIKIG